ncbi:MAG: protein-methionine-sulfoxide reductase catalytic subunit MsrP [Pseudolabrys sp.]|nr:protein-methionine-sulfoxide reductase catalytic subunit MsrP [Pseudolabrys sp.]
MHVIRRRGWEIPESCATPEHLFLDRRTFLGGTIGAAALGLSPASAQRVADMPDPSSALYPFKRNAKYVIDRDVTKEEINLHYNNFYEFGYEKGDPAVGAQKLPVRPWTVKIDGMVEKPQEIAIDDLIKAMPVEERLYRHRCVERWSMAIPWTGFQLSEFVKFAKPLSSATYLRMETFLDPKVAPNQRGFQFSWPYVEGLTMAEAMNDLAFLVVGAYGKPVAKQMGAPLRLAVPWKYGFKSVKSIVKFTFTDKRPKTLWEIAGPSEYGFWANVNPQVAHPRWSQAMEEIIGTSEYRPTMLFNGYGEQVAGLYKGLEKEPLYM